MFRIVTIVVLLTIGAVAMPASAPDGAVLQRFVGDWSCKGNFTSNGAPIAANLSIQSDERSGALIVRHDDIPPGAYHALEVWMANKAGPGVRAAISDQYSGMRWFESAGWAGNALAWTRLENGIPAEQFVYEFKGDALQVEWSIARGGAMKLGDTLLCRRG
ncbi:MAG TPA: hypothetical protein VNH39_13880 [Steroidobacteraceae bacterium]|nr:hypothetical protein [Steroidobacteraceae bacterium]